MQDGGGLDQRHCDGSGPAENVRIVGVCVCETVISALCSIVTIAIAARCRDLVYFNDAWISRIKPDVGDNWRLKVS